MPPSPCTCCIKEHSLHLSLPPSSLSRQRRSFSFLLPSLLDPWNKHSPRRLRTLLALFLSLTPTLVLSQNSSLYTPRYSSGSAVVNNTLYLVGGTTGIVWPFSATGDVLSVSLANPFTADAVPWINRTAIGVAVADARVAATKDQSRLVLVGMNSTADPLAIAYDILLDQWAVPPAGSPNPPISPRVSVGIVTDTNTGLLVMYGGLIQVSNDVELSSELDILNPSSNSTIQWTWLPPTTEAMMPALFEPMIFYLSGIQSILVLGGCDGYAPNQGLSSCAPLSKGYLINSGQQASPFWLSNPSTVVLNTTEAAMPMARLSPCNTMLPNGDVLVHGGVTFGYTESLNDTWLLNTKTWTWTLVNLQNAPTQGRAGAACELVAPNVIMVVGGYDGGIVDGKQFTDIQIGFINTETWMWTNSFNPHVQKTGLSKGAILGISAGAVIVFGLIMFLGGRLYWRRRKRRLINKPSRSNNPRHDSQSNFPLIPPSPFEDSGLDSPDRLGSPSTPSLNSGFLNSRSNRPLPLIIMPLSTPSSPTDRISQEPTSQHALKMNRFGAKREVDLPESERLPQNEADIQYGHYVRTLQHNRQYEKRQSPLHRNPTDASGHTTFQHDDDANLHYQPDMATGVINLRDIEFGEEFSTSPRSSYRRQDHGGFNPARASRGKDSSGAVGGRQNYLLESSPSHPTGHFRTDKAEISNDSREMENFEEEEEYNYDPAVAGSRTALEAAREACAARSPDQTAPPMAAPIAVRAVEASTICQGYSTSSVALSFLTESEALVDNRPSRRTRAG